MNKFCKQSGGDTGVGKCDAVLGVIYGLVFAPLDFTVPVSTDTGELLSFLQESAYADDPVERIYPIVGVGNVTFEGEEPTVGSLASTGKPVPLRAGTQAYLLEYESGICMDAVLNRFNNWKGGVYVLTVDPVNRIFGYAGADGSLKPIPCQSVSVFGGGFGDGQNPTTTKIRISLGSDLVFKRNISTMDFEESDSIDSLVGFQTARLTADPATPGGVKVVDSCDRTTLVPWFTTDLTAVSSWNGVNKTTGADTAPTSVSSLGDTVAFVFPAGTYEIGFADPSKRADAMKGWVSDTVTLTFPAQS